jgi:hypothetical protein
MAVIFYPPRTTGGGGGAATWGSITGTLSAQTDLQTALNGKSDVGHTHTNINSLVGFATSENTSAPNNIVNASRLLVVASTTNADFVIEPKGTGAIIGELPDSAIAGGNKRGANAIDLQLSRTLATQVASGQSSVLIGGTSNIASGQSSGVFAGNSNTTTRSNTVILGGGSNSITGTADGASILAGLSNSNSGSNASIIGGQNNIIDNSVYTAIISGQNNQITGGSGTCVIVGGQSNVLTNALGSVILGGRGFTAQNYNILGFNANIDGTRNISINAAVTNTAVFNNVDLWLSNNDNTPRTLRFYEQYNSAGVFPNGTNYVAFRAPNSIAADVTWTLPNADGTNGQVLQTNGAGALSWVTAGGGGGSNVTLSYVRNIVNNLNTGFNFSFVPNSTQEVFGIASTGRAFWGVTDANSAIAYTASTVNGTYSQIALTNNGSGSGGFIFDIGPSAEGFVYYRSAAIANWTRWNGTSMVPVTTYASSPGSVNSGTGLGYNGNFAFVAFGTPEAMRYSTDNADTWANGSSSWFHTSGTQHHGAHIAIGVVGSGSTWVIITQLSTNPVSANCSYGAINSTPTKQLFPNGYINPQAFTSNGTVMYVYFENGMLGRTTDGANWTYLAVGNGEALTTFASWSLVIRSSDVLLISNAKVYSIAEDLSAVNWVRLVDNIAGTSGGTRKNHQKIGVISNELYIPATSGIVTNSVGYISSSIGKYTFA